MFWRTSLQLLPRPGLEPTAAGEPLQSRSKGLDHYAVGVPCTSGVGAGKNEGTKEREGRGSEDREIEQEGDEANEIIQKAKERELL